MTTTAKYFEKTVDTSRILEDHTQGICLLRKDLGRVFFNLPFIGLESLHKKGVTEKQKHKVLDVEGVSLHRGRNASVATGKDKSKPFKDHCTCRADRGVNWTETTCASSSSISVIKTQNTDQGRKSLFGLQVSEESESMVAIVTAADGDHGRRPRAHILNH